MISATGPSGRVGPRSRPIPGQAQRNLRILPFDTLKQQVTVMLLDQAVTDTESQSGSFPPGFGGAERIADPLPDAVVESNSVVTNAKLNEVAATVRELLGGDTDVFHLFVYSEFAVDCLAGVAQDIHEHLLDFVIPCPGRRKVTVRKKKEAVPTPEDGRLTVCEVQQPRLDAMPLGAGFGRCFRDEDVVDDNRDVRQGAFAIETAVGVSSVRAADQRLRYVNMVNH